MIATITFTAGSTGDRTIALLPFTPIALRFKVLKPGYTDSTIPFVAGGWTNGFNNDGFALVDNGGIETYEDSAKCLLAYDVISGVTTQVIEATFVSFGDHRFKLNFTVANASYQVQTDLVA